MFNKIKIISCALLMLPLVFGGYAQADSSGWIKLKESRRFTQKIRKNHAITSIDCKSGAGVEPKNGAMMLKLDYRKYVKGDGRWNYKYGTAGSVRRHGAKLRKEGYKPVRVKTFRHRTGILLGCGLWVKR
ncbi:MAG: hypothetical protein AAGF28_03215 [Pseudomonadota bacterium]